MTRILIATTLLLLSLTRAAAATYYAGPSGDNGNTGLTADSPWTLTKGMTNMGPDVTLILLDGTYSGTFTFTTSGTAGQYQTIQAANKWGAILTGSSARGLAAQNASSGDFTVIDGLKIDSPTTVGIGDSTMIATTVRNCWITNATDGIILISTNTTYPTIIENNLIEDVGTGDNQHHGIYIGGTGAIIRNNVIRGCNGGFGMQLYTGSSGVTVDQMQVYNNVVYLITNQYSVTLWGAYGNDGSNPGTNYMWNNTLDGGISLSYGTACLTNNILVPPASAPTIPLVVSAVRDCFVVADYNLSSVSIRSNGVHGVTASPGFVGTGDYRLTPTSAAINAGATMDYAYDLLATPRPVGSAWDIGAYEYSGSKGRMSGNASLSGKGKL